MNDQFTQASRRDNHLMDVQPPADGANLIYHRCERERWRDAAPHAMTGVNQAAQSKDAEPQESAPGCRPLSDVQREHHVKQALTRFVHNKAKPEELETLRYNPISNRRASSVAGVPAR